MNIIIKESTKGNLNTAIYNKVLKEVATTDKKSGIIKKINYLIKSNTIILF